MKKILIILFCFLLSSCSDYKDTDVRKEAAQRISENQLKVSQNALNNYIESNFGCPTAEFFVYVQQIGVINSVSYQCQGDNLPAGNDGYKIIILLYVGISLILSILFGIVYAVSCMNALKATASQDKRKRQNASIIIEAVFVSGLIFLFEMIVMTFVGVSVAIADQHTRNEMDSQALIDDSQEVADKRSKNDIFKNILSYMVCVNSREFDGSKQSADIHFFETDEGVALKARFERCDLDGGFLYDTLGIAVSESYGIAKDYKQQQAKAIIEAVRQYVTAAAPYAVRISNGDQAMILKASFDKNMTCDDLLTNPSVDEYDLDDLAKYAAKANYCITQKPMTRLLRIPSFENTSPEWKSVNVCTGNENQESTLIDRKTMISNVEACVATNCSDIVNSSSPYACGVALSKYNNFKDDRWKDLITIYALNPDKQADYTSAKKPLNSLNAQFAFLEKRTFFMNDGDLIEKVSIPVKKGKLSREDLEQVIMSEYNANFIESSEEDYASKFYNLLVNKNGLFGLKRFFTCSANLFAVADGYYCKSFTYERRLAGATMVATSAMLDGVSLLTKKHKPTAKSKKDDIELRNHQKDLEGVGLNKTILAMSIPLAAKGLGVLGGEDIFGEQYYNVTGDTGFIMAVAVIVSSSPSVGSLLALLAGGLKFLGVFFIYGYELMLALAVWTFLITILATVNTRIVTHKMAAILDIGTNTTRNDLDRKPISLFLEELGITIVSMPVAFFSSKMFLDVMLVCIIGDMSKFASVTLGVAANESLSNTIYAVIIALILFVIVMKQSVSFIRMFYENILNMVHGKMNHVDMRVHQLEERQSFTKTLKNKQL
ncbi:hypothetical protein N0614_09470 [Pseudomonas aeruginosa]|nr:hypothetical protein [Pseudomonas aeruginosa]